MSCKLVDIYSQFVFLTVLCLRKQSVSQPLSGKQRSVFVTRRRPPAAIASVATSGRGSIRLQISRPTPPRRPFAYLDASSSPRVYITSTTPHPDTPPQITAYKANFIGTCMQYAQGGPNCASDATQIALISKPTLLHVES